MTRIDRRNALKAMGAMAGLAAISRTVAMAVEPESHGMTKTLECKIPDALKAEHEEIHEELAKVTRLGGKTGEAAQRVARIMDPHFIKEEEMAMPPLGLLRPLAEGTAKAEMAQVIDLTDRLKKELPTMLKEHQVIVGALGALIEAAKQEDKPQALQLAERLKHHAKTEEEFLYPAAVLVGEYLKLKLTR